jgi:hypothetical protein
MSLSLLFDRRFDDYAAAVRENTGLWLFVHVPKTAGSSLSGELARLAPPYHNIHIDHTDRSRPGPERFDLVVEGFLAEAATKPFRSASGHILHRHMEQIVAAIPGVKPVTMLRDPLKRVISDYRYQRSPMHPLSAEVIRKAPDFAAFLDLPGPRNRMAKHLVPLEMIRRERLEESVAYVMDRFAFVGLQEAYALSFRLLTALITGAPVQPTEKRRVNEEGEAVELTPELEALARARNAVDCAIYEALAQRFAGIRSDLEAWLATRMPAEALARSA